MAGGAVLPDFALTSGLALVMMRALAVAALLSVFGLLAFRVTVGHHVPEAARMRGTRPLAVLALLALGGWGMTQAGDLAGSSSIMGALHALPNVLDHTKFGRLIVSQAMALAVTAILAARPRAALLAAGVALLLQAGHGHAAAMGGTGLLTTDAIHLLAAGGWLGGLLPLLLLIRRHPPGVGAAAARWFSPWGKGYVVALAVSAAIQGWTLVASVPGLVGTAYGWMVGVKLALMAVLTGFAIANRYRFAPALRGPGAVRGKAVLMRSIAVQTGFGLAIILAAALLSSLPPAMHSQPIWPFPDRFTLMTVQEAPEFRNEVLGAALALLGSLLLAVTACLIRRRWRWLLAAAALCIAGFAVPHLDLLFVPAYPTSFYHSPTHFAASGILRGAALFPDHCAACHGSAGHGDGSAAAGLPVPPADLTAEHLWMHSDGELFWWLAHGIPAPDGRPAMPGFDGVLSEDDRWALIDYIRAHNAGLAYHAATAWPVPLQAPALQARCLGGATSLAALHGRFVRLSFGAVPPAPVPDVTTLLITSDSNAMPTSDRCIADDATLPNAFAILTGLPAAELANAQILIDPQGWLRELQRDPNPGWNDAALLAAEITKLRHEKIASPDMMPGMCHADMRM